MKIKRLSINLLSLITLLFFSCSKEKNVETPVFKGGTEYMVTFNIDWKQYRFSNKLPIKRPLF